MKYFSTFSGIGGFELGIQNAYVETITNQKKRGIQKDSQTNEKEGKGLESKEGESIRSEGGQSIGFDNSLDELRKPTCVGYSEINKYAIQIYQKHFPNHKNYGDITQINAKELPDFELFVGGFPCQSFSIAGKRRGFDDTRGTLFFDIARILQEKKPRLFLLENVKGLLSHDNGRTFKTIISTLNELGYDVQWEVLNSKNFGVPQNRERVLIAGHLRGTPRPEVFPIQSTENTIDKERVTSSAIDANYWKGIDNHGQRTSIVVKGMLSDDKWDHFNESSRRVYDVSGIAPTIPTVAGGGHTPKISTNEITEDLKIRKLTPIECERLQGFPDGWTEGVSDTQRYKTLGNAVTVNVIQYVISKLLT